MFPAVMTCVTAAVLAAFAKATMLEMEVQRCWHSLENIQHVSRTFDMDVERYSPPASWASTTRRRSTVWCTLIGIAEGESRVDSGVAVAE